MTERKLSDEPRWITEPMLAAIHAQQIERYGGAHGIVDRGVVQSALARPINRWHYDPQADLPDLAAAYLVGFTRSQGFLDGNKRTGLATALVFLSINDAPLHVPGVDLYALTMAIAQGKADDTVASRYLRQHFSAT